jgi:hypothetical protein
MIRHKWIIGARNKLVNIYWECDSCASIEGSRLTEKEREDLKSHIKKAVDYIDKHLPKVK